MQLVKDIVKGRQIFVTIGQSIRSNFRPTVKIHAP